MLLNLQGLTCGQHLLNPRENASSRDALFIRDLATPREIQFNGRAFNQVLLV